MKRTINLTIRVSKISVESYKALKAIGYTVIFV